MNIKAAFSGVHSRVLTHPLAIYTPCRAPLVGIAGPRYLALACGAGG